RADPAGVHRQRQAVRRGRRPRPRVHPGEHARSPRAPHAQGGSSRAEGRAMIAARLAILVGLLALPATATAVWMHSAHARLVETTAAPGELAPVATASDVGYCNPERKRVLRRDAADQA